MRRIALVNQKGGVGKTTTAVNLGAALALQGKRVVLVDLDPQGNLSTHLGVEVPGGAPSTYSVLCEGMPIEQALRPTSTTNLSVLPTNIDLSGAEMELAATFGRESILNDAVNVWCETSDADYLIFDCPPSLGLLSVNGLVAAREVFIALQTEFFALQGMSKLVEIVQLLKRRLNPDLEISGIIPCLYDSRLRLAREVLGEIRRYFPGPVFRRTVRTNVKLAEAPSYGQSIFEYASGSPGAGDYRELALEVLAQEPDAPTAAGSPAPEEEPTSPSPEPRAAAAAPVEPAAQPSPPAPTDTAPTPPVAATEEPTSPPDVVLTPAPLLRANELPPLPEDAFRTSDS
jgi:chromosome partitioning protein